MALGAPTKYKPKYSKDIIEHLKEGHEIETFPAFLHEKYKVSIGLRTIFYWAKHNEEFKKAKELAVAYSRRKWKDIAINALEAKKPLANAWIFVMKNRFGYKDQPINEENDTRPTLAEVMEKVENERERKAKQAKQDRDKKEKELERELPVD